MAVETRNASGVLAKWVTEFHYAETPEEVRSSVLDAIINSLGTALGGIGVDSVHKAMAVSRDQIGRGTCTVYGTEYRMSAQAAAFVNGVIVNALGQEETHLASGVHPAETTVPVAVALCEETGGTLRDLVEAVTVGIEVTGAVASVALTPAVKYEACEAPAVYGTIGAAAAAAKVLGLELDRTAQALGLAANFAAGLAQGIVEGSAEYHYLKGLSGLHGHLAATLAQAGAVAASEAFEGRSGFYRLFANVSPDRLARFDVAADLEQRLARPWVSLDLTYKPYPVHYFNLPFLAAAKEARSFLGPSGTVDAVEIELGNRAVMSGGAAGPPFRWRGTAVASTQFCVACMLSRGHVTLEDQQDRDAPDILELCKRTTVSTLDVPQAGRLTLRSRGRVLDYDVVELEKSYEAVSAEDVFRSVVSHALGPGAADAALECLRGADASAPVASLLEFLRVPYPGAARTGVEVVR